MYDMNTNSTVKMVDTSLVNKILEQGQKLRNSMVGSILKNDPFNTDIIYSKHFNTPVTSSSDINNVKIVNPLTSIDEKRVEAYIKGEYMTKEEEKLALDTVRSMSAPDLCKTTERTLNSACLNSCKCYTCEIYNSDNLHCDIKRKSKVVDSTEPYSIGEVTRDIQEKYENENRHLLKYVDSLKVSVNNLVLNETGNRKVSGNDNVPYNFNQTYFLEYYIPDGLVNKCITNKSKVNSGLENNVVRFCSRRSNDAVNFKQIVIHDIKNLDKVSLDQCNIKFKISYRTQKQKSASTLGFANFNLGTFLLSKNLICNRSLPVFINENTLTIVVGNLKVSLLLGCGRLYFGQEFIDAISSINRDSVILDSDDSTNQLDREEPNHTTLNDNNYQINNNNNEKDEHLIRENVPTKCITATTYKKIKTSGTLSKHVIPKTKQIGKPELKRHVPVENIVKHKQSISEFEAELRNNNNEQINEPVNRKILKPQIGENEKQILFGFLYISEVQYLSRPISTYITCRPFCQNETSCSKLITDSTNPIFNFSQLVPLIYEDELLQLFRENYMLVEFWKKIDSTELVVGLTKIPLHQFYLAYRNPVFVKYLSKNKLPVIDVDWWEPIYTIDTDDVLGQVQILVALGTEDQINNLKTERGFSQKVVKAKFSESQFESKKEVIADKFNTGKPYSLYKFTHESNKRDFLQLKSQNKLRHNIPDRTTDKSKEIIDSGSVLNLKERDKSVKFTDKAINTSLSPKKIQTPLTKTFDVGIQSSLEMDEPVDKQNKTSPTQEMLGNFLNQLVAQRQKNVCVENSTNTEALETNRTDYSHQSLQNAQHNTNLELRKTTDLLDSLQKALYLEDVPNAKVKEKRPGAFRANIAINSANHLPSRKKCKSKKSRNRSIKNEENVLPSCYVTFETFENDLKITPVISKTVSPVWNYKGDVNLSEDFLTNSQRRLIFKVWRKATNTVLSPNMQTDIVLGFAAVDLTILLAGFPNVQGWFNIIDFTGKCNGQINIHITPLQNLSKYTLQKEECICNEPAEKTKSEAPKPDDEPSELFSRALKRKFTELDEITQRLRLRLSKVTNDDSDTSSDGVAEEFEKDINTLCIEEDFDLIDFEEESRKLNVNHDKQSVASRSESSTSKLQPLLTMQDEACCSSEDNHMHIAEENKASCSNSTTSLSECPNSILKLGNNLVREKELSSLDKHLEEGKQKIDSLLEKLSLISAETNNTFASRYVSGCSMNDYNAIDIDTEAILKELDHSSRPNIQSSLGFEPLRFQQLYGGSGDGNSLKNSGSSALLSSNSDTSLITNFSECRAAPDGQGNMSDEKLVKK